MKKLIPVLFILFLAISCKKDKCKDINCNYGTCVEGVCQCNEGYEGTNCDVAVNDKFTGNWEMPCDGIINIPGIDQQNIPTQTTVIAIEAGEAPEQVQLDFTIPIIGQSITMVGTVQGDKIIFEEQSFVIPQELVNTLLDAAGIQLPFPLGDIPITISGDGTLLNDELLVDIIIDGGILVNGEINCIGVRVP